MREGAGEHFRLWLRAGLTGCKFSQSLASIANQVAVELHVDASSPPTHWLNSTFDVHADANRVVIAVFPQIANERALVEFLNALGTDARWQVTRRAKISPRGGILVGLEWTTQNGDISETMGFAPFASMPVSRRAPYVAIATWPGGRANPFRGQSPTPPGRPGRVSFLDAPHGMEATEYERRWNETAHLVKALMSVPADDAALYRTTAFVIPPEHAAHLTG
jgi:hypothetical protein